MNFTFIRPFVQSEAEQAADRAGEATAKQRGGSWRRKAMLAGAGIGLAMLVRRLRSRSASGQQGASTESASTAESVGKGSKSGGSGLSRKVGRVVVFVATTLAIREIRKRLLGRSNRGR